MTPHHVFAPKGKSTAPMHSLSLCADGETFLACDDFTVTWWHMEGDGGASSGERASTDTTASQATSSSSCRLFDVIPDTMDNITQVLTTAAFHPTHASLFLVGSSDCWVGIGDLRDPPSRRDRKWGQRLEFQARHNPVNSQHNEILLSPSDALFLSNTASHAGANGHSVVTRDYLTLKLWDLRKTVDPVSCANVNAAAIPHLDGLYENDSIFDRFTVDADQVTGSVVTGHYGEQVQVWRPHVTPETLHVYHGRGSTHADGTSMTVSPGSNHSGSFCRSYPLFREASAAAFPKHSPDDPDHDLEADFDAWPLWGAMAHEEWLESRVKVVAMSDAGDSIAFASGDSLFVLNRHGPAFRRSGHSRTQSGAGTPRQPTFQ